MLAPGRYRARAIEGALSKAKTGTEQIEVKFQLLDYAETMVWRGFFTDKTEERTMAALASAGWDWIKTEFPSTAPEVSLVVEHEEDSEGRTWARIRWVNEPMRLKPKQPLTDDEVSALKARLFGGVPSAAVDFDPNDPNEETPF